MKCHIEGGNPALLHALFERLLDLLSIPFYLDFLLPVTFFMCPLFLLTCYFTWMHLFTLRLHALLVLPALILGLLSCSLHMLIFAYAFELHSS